MSALYDVVDEELFNIMRSVISTLKQRNNADDVTQALLCFLVRVANTWKSIHLLREHVPAGFENAVMVDIGALLRCMFDAYLQADYILRDPAKRMERATLYLEFQHVERYKAEQKMLSHNNPLSDTLRRSPHRAEGQARTKGEFDRVKKPFLKKDKKKAPGGVATREADTREQWYESNLGQLAQNAGRKDEYDTFVCPFSGCAHSSSYAILEGPPVTPEYVMQFASSLAARVVNLNVRYNGIDLGDHQPILDEMCKGVLHKD